MNFQLGMDYFNKNKFKEALEVFHSILNSSTELEDKANAANMIGGILKGAYPEGAKDELEYLYYYEKAIEICPTCINALLNIISWYGDEPWFHSNTAFFIKAYDLFQLLDKNLLNESFLKEVDEQKQLYEKVKNIY